MIVVTTNCSIHIFLHHYQSIEAIDYIVLSSFLLWLQVLFFDTVPVVNTTTYGTSLSASFVAASFEKASKQQAEQRAASHYLH